MGCLRRRPSRKAQRRKTSAKNRPGTDAGRGFPCAFSRRHCSGAGDQGRPSHGGGEAAAAAEEKTEFDVILTGDGGNKIAVIKEVRAITALGLTEAKALVEAAPKAVKEGVSKAEADEIAGKITAAGGTVEIK